MKTVVVIPNWNGKAWLPACLDSLTKQTADCSVIVVDNGSTDGSAELINEHYPEVKLIQLPKNTGFTGGVNTGIKAALKQGADFIALLNQDATADPDWLASLLKTMRQDPKIGIVTSKIKRVNSDRLDSTGEFYSIWGVAFPRGNNELDSNQYAAGDVPAASGGASLYRAAMLEAVGLFDQRYFAYYEDVDLSLRAQLLGWRVYFNPQAVVHHVVNSTTASHPGLLLYHLYKNQFYLYCKIMPGRLFWRYLPKFLLSWNGRALSLIKRGHLLAVLKAWLVILVNLAGLMAARLSIQKARKISIKQFDELLYKAPAPSQQKHFLLKSIRRQ